MSWVQVNLLARGLSRGWGGICTTALSGTPFAQVTPGWACLGGEGKAWALLLPFQDQATEAEDPWPACPDGLWVSQFAMKY